MIAKNHGTPLFILASQSPRRQELVEQYQVPFQVHVSECDESIVPGETPDDMVKRLAHAKACVVADEYPHLPVVGADTTVTIYGEILAKPADVDECITMLTKLQGRTHQVLTGHAVVWRGKGIEKVWSVVTEVELLPMTEEKMIAYWETGSPKDKAGSYGIQDPFFKQFVKETRGSYENVVGLDVDSLGKVLQSLKVIEG